MQQAYFAGGCFWCLDAVFRRTKGVVEVVSGFAGGHVVNPSYQAVCTGTTGHAETVEVTFDPDLISYEVLLDIFFQVHDPTQLNRQGHDVGTEYRSAIFYTDAAQHAMIEAKLETLEAAEIWSAEIVTEVAQLDAFYPAEDYHQDFFTKHPNQGYCQIVVAPKLEKFAHRFADWMVTD